MYACTYIIFVFFTLYIGYLGRGPLERGNMFYPAFNAIFLCTAVSSLKDLFTDFTRKIWFLIYKYETSCIILTAVFFFLFVIDLYCVYATLVYFVTQFLPSKYGIKNTTLRKGNHHIWGSVAWKSLKTTAFPNTGKLVDIEICTAKHRSHFFQKI